MNTDVTPIFDAALGLPKPIRADLAAKLLASLDAGSPLAPSRTPDEWAAIIKARSDALHDGTAEFIDSQQFVDELQGIVDRANSRP